MTDGVPADRLGRGVGRRSILGVGAGALAPVTIGLAYDLTLSTLALGDAFSILAVGALVVTVCALLLHR